MELTKLVIVVVVVAVVVVTVAKVVERDSKEFPRIRKDTLSR
jgi:hypothetical protein